MQKIANFLVEQTWFKIRRDMPRGTHYNLECPKCGAKTTCRCHGHKQTFLGLCDNCAGIDYSKV